MDVVARWLVYITISSSLVFSVVNAEDEAVRHVLVKFMEKLSPGNAQRDANFGWNDSTDPCTNKWEGVTCNAASSVKKIVLDRHNLTGVFDASSLCIATATTSLFVLSLNENNVSGSLSGEMSRCKSLTHLYLRGNRVAGSLPSSLSKLDNLKRLDVSGNDISGELPDLSRASGLLSFLVQDNQISGGIPSFNFSKLQDFNVSNNKLTGPIPDVKGHFTATSFSENPGLCGEPLPNPCPSPPPPAGADEKKGSSKTKYFIYSGYAILGLIVVLLALKVIMKKRHKVENASVERRRGGKSSSSEAKTGGNRSEYSIASVESGLVSSSLVILSSPVVNGLKFEDLLQSPAELVGRGRHGSLYKVTVEGSVFLAVKRIKDWKMSRDDFNKRMQRIDRVENHPNVMSALAYYCSKQEKLLVYEFQHNGSLFMLLHGSQNGQAFGWERRLNVAAKIAEALAFMHQTLGEDGIAHGNLKSSNILLNNSMEPCISEYGLMVVDESQDKSFLSETDGLKKKKKWTDPPHSTFKVDIYAFGVILLELLTGKLVQSSASDLATWVNSVVKEEWTLQVFDKALISEGANEDRMVNLLQIALKCIRTSPDARPRINQVAEMINSVKEEEEERSITSDP